MEMEKHLEQIEELEQTLFELRGEIGGGRHLPPGTRVLCLKDNPAQEWEDLSRAAMDRLKTENEALLKRLKDLEDNGVRGTGDGESSQDLVPRASWEAINEEKLRLEDELKQKEKRLLRLRQVRQVTPRSRTQRLTGSCSHRCTPERVKSSATRSSLSSGSSSRSTQTARCGSRPSST